MSKVFHSPVTNARFSDKGDYQGHLQEYFEFVKSCRLRLNNTRLLDGNVLAALRLRREQYQYYRSLAFGTKSFSELASWINQNNRAILTAPYVDINFSEILPVEFKVEFVDAEQHYDSDGWLFEWPDFTEVFLGKIWECKIIFKSNRSRLANSVDLKRGLASFGIYTNDTEFYSNDRERHFEIEARIPEYGRSPLVNDTIQRQTDDLEELDMDDDLDYDDDYD